MLVIRILSLIWFFFRSLLLDPTIDIWLNIWHTTRQSCEEQSDIHKWSSDSSMVICRPDCFQSQEKLDQEVQFQKGTGKGDCQAYLIFEFFTQSQFEAKKFDTWRWLDDKYQQVCCQAFTPTVTRGHCWKLSSIHIMCILHNFLLVNCNCTFPSILQ